MIKLKDLLTEAKIIKHIIKNPFDDTWVLWEIYPPTSAAKSNGWTHVVKEYNISTNTIRVKTKWVSIDKPIDNKFTPADMSDTYHIVNSKIFTDNSGTQWYNANNTKQYKKMASMLSKKYKIKL